MERKERRIATLAAMGASSEEIDELLDYGAQSFQLAFPTGVAWPLPDELFVHVWEQYAVEVEQSHTIRALEPYLVQMRFPVRKGMSLDRDYLSATKKGCSPELLTTAIGLGLKAPEQCTLFLHPTPAGRIPIITARNRTDFVLLVQALTMRNEPRPIPLSMGACVVAGYNNWHRIHLLREELGTSLAQFWSTAFPGIEPKKELYQDCFVILSSGTYSSVSATDLGLPPRDWLQLSLAIRREHEAAHYFTRRVFGAMRDNLLDEVLADYWGTTQAAGAFRSDWMLRFFGLESFPRYRMGGRLENYRGDPPLSDGAFLILQRMLVKMVQNLESFDSRVSKKFQRLNVQPEIFLALTRFTCDELAAEGADQALFQVFQDALDARRQSWNGEQLPECDATPGGAIQ